MGAIFPAEAIRELATWSQVRREHDDQRESIAIIAGCISRDLGRRDCVARVSETSRMLCGAAIECVLRTYGSRRDKAGIVLG